MVWRRVNRFRQTTALCSGLHIRRKVAKDGPKDGGAVWVNSWMGDFWGCFEKVNFVVLLLSPEKGQVDFWVEW